MFSVTDCQTTLCTFYLEISLPTSTVALVVATKENAEYFYVRKVTILVSTSCIFFPNLYVHISKYHIVSGPIVLYVLPLSLEPFVITHLECCYY
jgi:hypothetical protein